MSRSTYFDTPNHYTYPENILSENNPHIDNDNDSQSDDEGDNISGAPVGRVGSNTMDGAQASQDLDFQPPAAIELRPRGGRSGMAANVPAPRPNNTATEESTCCICFEVWTNSGKHRLVALKCGHLFGEECILSWIRKSTTPTCPECKYPAKVKDVRRLWSKSIVSLDISERELAAKSVREERERRMASEQEALQIRMSNDLLKAELLKLQRKHDRQKSANLRLKKKLKVHRLDLDDPLLLLRQLLWSYSLFRTVPLSVDVNATQYMGYRECDQMLVCTRSPGLFNNNTMRHGVAKLSMIDFSNTFTTYIPLHDMPIKDLQCYGSSSSSAISITPSVNEGLILTTSTDKTLKLTSMSSNTVVHAIPLDSPGWSCAWSSIDPNIFYCATKGRDSTILTFDIRKTESAVRSFTNPSILGLSPIHSIVPVGQSGSAGKTESLLCGNLVDMRLVNSLSSNDYNLTVDGSQQSISSPSGSQTTTATAISLSSTSSIVGDTRKDMFSVPEMSCHSVSVDPVSGLWMGSFRSKHTSKSIHYVGTFSKMKSPDTNTDWMGLEMVQQVVGAPAILSAINRTSIFTRGDDSLHLATGSEGSTHVWYGTKGISSPISNRATTSESASSQQSTKISSTAPFSFERVVLKSNPNNGTINQNSRSGSSQTDPSSAVKDVKAIRVGSDEFLVSLMDKRVELYQWAAAEEELEDEDDEEEEEEKGTEDGNRGSIREGGGDQKEDGDSELKGVHSGGGDGNGFT